MMKLIQHYLVMLIVAFAVHSPAIAQKSLPVAFYRQMTGQAGKEFTVTMNLVRTGDTIYGEYYLTPSYAGAAIPFRETRMICGKISSNGSFRMREWAKPGTDVFKGRFDDDQHISGSLMPSGARKGLLVRLTAQTDQGMAFSAHHLKEFKRISAGSKSPKAKAQLVLLLPESGTGPAPDSLRSAIAGLFTGKPSAHPSSADKILAGVAHEFFTDYITGNQSMYQQMPGASFEWALLRFLHIIYNTERRISFSMVNYSFTGGAHGMETEVFRTIDTKTGREVRLASLFRQGYEPELTRMLTRKLHRQINQPETSKLSESGYFTDEIRPTENFYLNSNGIGFRFNRYEIAPYAFGSTEIFLTYEELRAILR